MGSWYDLRNTPFEQVHIQHYKLSIYRDDRLSGCVVVGVNQGLSLSLNMVRLEVTSSNSIVSVISFHQCAT